MEKHRLLHNVLVIFFSLVSLQFSGTNIAGAVLLPEEIVVIVNEQSHESVQVGKLFMRLRDLPETHLVQVAVPDRDEISRKVYDESIAVPLKSEIQALQEKGMRIRCLVTTYGIPLRIGAQKPSRVSEEEIERYEKLLKQKKKEKTLLLNERGAGNAHNNQGKELQKELRSLQKKLDRLLGRDTIASVDSELTLLLYSPYPIKGAQPNPEFLPNRKAMTKVDRVLMVSRLDGPTPKLAQGLVRTAIEVEKRGLSGKVYLDARGLKPSGNGYGEYDEEIRKTAKILEKGFVPVVLDDRPELFRKGEAESAALYCGWYSLADYQDVFEWSRGAVGYHVASAECRSLRDPKKNYWVKRMIEEGVVATLGPVSEPYLSAFPLPSMFFSLLMSGRYALVEVYAMTNPMLSWRMVLIGDPLYNPYKNRPSYFFINPPPAPR